MPIAAPMVVALALAALLGAAAAAEAGLLMGAAPQEPDAAVECVGFRDGGEEGGAVHLLLANPAPGGLEAELQYPDPDRTVLHTEHGEVAGTSEVEVQAPASAAGYAVRVRAPGGLAVRASSSPGDGRPGRAIPCSRSPAVPN